jgi:peptidoglycan LD-endopeptidase CwlK
MGKVTLVERARRKYQAKDKTQYLDGRGGTFTMTKLRKGAYALDTQEKKEMTSKFVFGQRSENSLKGVNPSLVKVVRRALELSPVDFTVIEGVRTLERQKELYAQGRTTPGKVVTWTMKSKHIEGNAVDLLPVTGWDNLASFKAVSKAMFQAAAELGVKITWGADWNGNGIQEKGETDSPHFEISA